MSNRKLNYDNPGTKVDLDSFMVNLSIKNKEELLLIIKHVAESCDMKGKGFVNQFEDCIRKDIGYTHKFQTTTKGNS